MDCGPVCLRMITSFYGKNYSLETLREKASLTREGVSLLGISEAAEKIGFRTLGAALDFKELQKAPLPCIVQWNQAHFIVVYRISSSSRGDILQRTNDHSRIQNFLTSSGLSTLFSFFHLIIFGTVLLIYSLLIFFIFITGTAGYMGYIWLFMNKRAQLHQKRFAQQSANQGNIVQLINGMQEIKLSTSEQQKRWEWESIQVRLFRLSIKGLTLKQYQSSRVTLQIVRNLKHEKKKSESKTQSGHTLFYIRASTPLPIQ